MSSLEAMIEAERRGILPPDKLAALAELRKRGFVPESSPERSRLQAQLDAELAASDAAGERLKSVESQTAIARPILRGAVDIADGVLALPKLIASAPIAGYNVLTGSNVPLPIDQSVGDINPRILADQIAGQAPARNVLAAQNDNEQLASTVTRGLGGVLGGLGIGGALGAGAGAGAGSTVANVGRTLAANPGLQTAGAVTGGLSSEVVRQRGGGAAAQLAAGLAGGLAPSLGQAGLSAATRGAIRGGEAGRARVEQSLEDFVRAGTTPTVGQATQNRFLQAAETLLSRIPGSAGTIARKAETQAQEIGAGIDRTASRIAVRTSAEDAGRTIVSGVKGPGGFVERTKAIQRQLYDELDQHIAPDRPTTVTNTQSTLKELTEVDPGAARTTGNLVNARIKQIASDLAADAQSGTVPYSAIKALRTRIGELLDDDLTADVPQKQLRQLYGALSEDMKEAATQSGPLAQRAWARANDYTRERASRLEILDEVIQKEAKPEDVYTAATSGTAEGATRLRAVMDSLPADAQQVVSARVLRRLGRAVASQQDDLGEKFSTETFLSNWNNKLSTEAKSALFDRFGTQYRRDIDALSKVASNLRKGSQVFKNPSGTAQGGAQIATASAAGAALAALTQGNALPAVGLATTLIGANRAAALMTNPRFVRWLAASTQLPASVYTSQLNQLQGIGERNQDALLIEAADFLKKHGGKQVDATNDETQNRERRQ